MENVAFLLVGLIAGIVIVLLFHLVRRREAKTLAQELLLRSESQRAQDLEAIIDRMKDSFGALSLEALSRNTEEFLKLAGETLSKQTQLGGRELDEKKKLIDQTLEAIKHDLQNVQQMVTGFEKDRENKFGALTSNLKTTARTLSTLQETTSRLREALGSSRVRGQWGERMAEDVLQLAGFIEGVNYNKQKSLETASTRPDYTFLLPRGLKVNMDVKFPLDNYLRFLEEESETDRERFKRRFIQDVRERIREVTGRDYINPGENTIDYVIVFIPNEQVYSFINEHDRSIIDDAMKNRVILCSPITLYAVLAVIRQAVDNFHLEKTASRILSLLGGFQKQYDLFVQSMERMGKRIEETQKEFNQLTTTRRNQLERQLERIEDLRKQQTDQDTPAIGNGTEAVEEIDSRAD